MRDSKFKRFLIPIYESLYFFVDNFSNWIVLRTKYRLHIMNSIQTIRYIKKNHCSIARYGDGELSFALNIEHEIAFQNSSDALSKGLKDVLQECDNPKLLLCMPHYLNSLKGCTAKCKRYWWEWGKANQHQRMVVNQIRALTGKDYRFGDSLITRPYMDRQDCFYAEKVFAGLKTLWQNEHILIVEGEQTRLGVGNDLFADASTIERILCPATNAFDRYAEIKEAVLRHYTGQMVILALGPTATVLAAD